MTDRDRRGAGREFGRYLELQNLGLNLPFALGFLFVAVGGWPSARTAALVVVAFLGARTAGHSFNRWADRELDARNPRTKDRALVTGRYSTRFSWAVTAVGAAMLLGAAYLLNPLALVLTPPALAVVFLYSYTKRFSSLSTVVLGAVESLIPAGVYVAVRSAIPGEAIVAVVALTVWGTAFETIHSLGDLEIDRSLGLWSLPVRLGPDRSVRLVILLHLVALLLFAVYGALSGLRAVFFTALGGIVLLVFLADRGVRANPSSPRRPFELHFAMSALFLLGIVGSFVLG